jgi:hypothetical protein
MKGITRRLALAASGFVFFLGAGSASAVTILPFFLTLNGTNGGTVTPPTGSTAYQFWVDPSAISGGTFGFDFTILANGSLTMTAFTANPAAELTSNLKSPNEFLGNGGDVINGNFAPLEIGTLTVANAGGGPGQITLFLGDYVDSTFVLVPATTPQIFAQVPEPGTLVLLGVGMVGLAATVRARRQRL